MAVDNDRAFLAEQYRLHADRVFQRCLLMSGGDTAWAEDVTHEAFMRLMQEAPTLDKSMPLLGWLLTVAHRLCLDKLRRRKAAWRRLAAIMSMSMVDKPATTPAAVEDLRDEDALLRRLRRSLDELPAKERTALIARYIEGERQYEIATALGCSEGYVSKLLTRALERLRRLEWEVEDV